MEEAKGVEVIAELEDGICIARADIDSLREQDLNARVMDDVKFDQLVANIEKRGTLEQLPYGVLTDRGVEIVSGHHRTRAARKAGLDHINILLDRSKLSRSSIAAKQLAHNAIEGTDDPDMLKKIAAIITDVDDMLESAIDQGYFENVVAEAQRMPVPQVEFNWKTVQFTFLDHQDTDLRKLMDCIPKSDIEGVAPLEAFDPFVDALNSTKKFADVRNVGAAVWWMAHSALRELGKDDGKAYTPIMSVFGRAAMPKEVADGIKAIIKEKQRTGEIDSPWEIFELMLGRVHGSGKTD